MRRLGSMLPKMGILWRSESYPCKPYRQRGCIMEETSRTADSNNDLSDNPVTAATFHQRSGLVSEPERNRDIASASNGATESSTIL